MDKKRIYFVQTGCVFNNEHFLPYAAGLIASYAFGNEKIAFFYELADIIYKCDNFDETVDNIENPYIVAFSNYMWNFKFNLELAEEIKKRYPECKVIFGGHQISDTVEWLERYPFIDFTIYGEGEKVFSDILLALCTDNQFENIPNIAYRNGTSVIGNVLQSICMDVNDIPSPYLSGIFDNIVKQDGVKFAAVIETSRGCPYHCAYCDWGDYNLPMRRFDVERVKKEIRWLGQNSIVFVVLADSNFGMYESDDEITDAFINTKKEFGFPKAVEIAFAKQSSEKIFCMNKKLYENNMSRGATLSMQTLSPVALKNIGRENMTKEKFARIMQMYTDNDIPAYTELILGLPGETYESFCEGIDYLLENGQHNSIHVFFCEVLPNAVMGKKEYIEKHGMQVIRRDFNLRNGMTSAGVKGESCIVVATDTMNREMFLKAMLYAFTVQVFHNFGLCRVFALYFRFEEGKKYYEFYNSLMMWFVENSRSFSGRVFKHFKEKLEASVAGVGFDIYENAKFGSTQFNLSDGAFLELVSNCAEFYNDMRSFLSSYMKDEEILNEIIEFQSSIIRKPTSETIEKKFTHNWIEYYTNIMKNFPSELKKENVCLNIYSQPEYEDLQYYVKSVVIKGRRTGKSIILNEKNAFDIT